MYRSNYNGDMWAECTVLIIIETWAECTLLIIMETWAESAVLIIMETGAECTLLIILETGAECTVLIIMETWAECTVLLKPSLMLGFKLQVMLNTEGVLICSNHTYFHHLGYLKAGGI